MSSNRLDPTEWANRRKAAMERAKQLREERKNGTTNDAEHTFAPQINKRPSYLNKQDSLDALAAQTSPAARSDDPMEQPLPGARRQQPAPELPSPGSDTLGREMKRFPSGSNHPSEGGGGGGSQPYRSKFMQQYQQNGGTPVKQDAGSPFKGDQNRNNSNKIENADDVFMNMLRSDNAAGTTTKRRESGPGWNDDTSLPTDAFGNSKIGSRAPGGRTTQSNSTTTNAATRRRTSTEPQLPPQQRQQAMHTQQRGQYHTEEEDDGYVAAPRRANESGTKPVGRRDRGALPDWNNDFTTNDDQQDGGSGSYSANYAAQQRGGKANTSPRSGGASGFDKVSHLPRQAVSPREGYGEGFGASRSMRAPADPAVSQARSRLSLLKSKMRRSESSGGSRTSAARDDDNGSIGGESVENMRRTAPMAVGGGGAARGGAARGTMSNDPYGPDAYPPEGAATMGRVGRRQIAPARGAAHDDDGYNGGYSGHGGAGVKHGNSPSASAYGDYAESVPKNTNVGASSGRGRRQQQQQQPPMHDNYSDDPYQDAYQPSVRSGGQRGAAGAAAGRPPSSGVRPPSSGARSGASNAPRDNRGGVAMNFSAANDPYGDPMGAAADKDPGELLECPDCGRKFGPIPYEKHVKICAKVFMQKRKVFDSKKMRVADNPELVQMLKKKEKEEKMQSKGSNAAAKRQSMGAGAAGGGGAAAAPIAAARKAPNPMEQPVGGGDSGKSSKWKDQSKAFREAMKAARQVTQAIAAGAPLPPPVISAPDPSLIPCPHCGRRFNEKAAERHIPKCQDIKAKPTSLKRGAGGGGGVNGSIPAARANRGKLY